MDKTRRYPVPSQCPVCGDQLEVVRVQCGNCGTGMDGHFSTGRFANLSQQQWHFIETFVRCKGKIKDVDIALPFFVYDLTRSTLATGGMFIALTVPRLLLGSVAGVFVDRWDRRRTMIAADVSRAAIMLPLLLVRSPERVWIVYLVAFLEAAIAQFFLPAKSAIIPRLVGEEDLLPANSLNSLSDSLTRLVGPALGGALFGLLGLASVVYLDSLSFLVSGLAIALIAVPPAPVPAASPARSAASPWAAVWREWLDGLRLVRRDRLIAALFAIMATVMIGEGIM